MRQLTILVDMDDTIEHLLEAWVACLNERHGTQVRYGDITEWNLCNVFPTLTEEQIYAPLVEEDFWKTVRPMEDAAEVLKWTIDQGHKVYIVTASDYRTISAKMEHVLFKHFPFIKWENVIITSNKQMIRGDILIDDAPHNLEGGDYVKILMSAGHNRRYHAEENDMFRVYTWRAVQMCIAAVAAEEEYVAGFEQCKDDLVMYMECGLGIYLHPYQRILLKSVLGGKV